MANIEKNEDNVDIDEKLHSTERKFFTAHQRHLEKLVTKQIFANVSQSRSNAKANKAQNLKKMEEEK